MVAPVAVTTGPARTVTVTVPTPVQLAALVPVTLYVVVAVGVTESVPPDAPVLHK